MSEAKQKIEPKEEEVEIQIFDEPESEESEDELSAYSKKVSRRVNKLNQKARDAENRAAAASALAQAKDQELQQYRNLAAQQQQTTLQAEEDKIKSQEQQVDEIYRQAVQSGDAELMSQATTLKNDIAIKKEKVKTAKARQDHAAAGAAQQQAQWAAQQHQPNPQEQPVQQPVQPTSKALSWHDKNPWYGDQSDEENLKATQFAYFTHYNLIQEGYEPDSSDYYQELDSRVGKAYPTLQSSGSSSQAVAQDETKPPAQRVVSATSSGRQKTRGNKDGVRFTSSELDRIRGLKPHNMSDDQWMKVVAKEKQKIQLRGAT